MKKLFRTVLEQVLPTLSVRRANKYLAQKINSEDSQSNVSYMDNIDEMFQRIVSEWLKVFHKETSG